MGFELFSKSEHMPQDLKPTYAHQVIGHAERYVDCQVHTNRLENFWSLFKRGPRLLRVNLIFPQTFPFDLRNIRIVPKGTDSFFLPAYGEREGLDLLAAHADTRDRRRVTVLAPGSSFSLAQDTARHFLELLNLERFPMNNFQGFNCPGYNLLWGVARYSWHTREFE